MKRVMKWIAGVLDALVCAAFMFYRWGLDWEGRPGCHKVIGSAFRQWDREQGGESSSQTNFFPNISGRSVDSLSAIREGMGGYMEWAESYNYVPGLREDDPGDLVLLYVNRPTRWTQHGPPPTILKEKAWIVVPVDFKMGGRARTGPGELSERISFDEFRRRLTHTLDFIRTNERPHWQTVVADHTKFLNSIESVRQ